MVILQGDGFKLRPITIWDTDAYFETMQDPATKQSLNSTPKSRDEALAEINEFLQKMERGVSEVFTVEVDGEYAGNVILEHEKWDPSSTDGRVHLWMHPAFRGRGLATKALDAAIQYGFRTKYKQIFAQCKASNTPVIRINESLGFVRIDEFTDEHGVSKIRWVKRKQ